MTFTYVHRKLSNPYIDQKPIYKTYLSYGQRIYAYQRASSGNRLWDLVRWNPRVVLTHPNLRIHKIEMASESTPPSLELRKKMQAILDERLIPIDCVNPEPLINKNRILQDNIKEYLQAIKESGKLTEEEWGLKKRLFDHFACISFEELQKGIKVCCEIVNTVIGKNDYSIGIIPNKSSLWMAKMALPLLDRAPIAYFHSVSDKPGENDTDKDRQLKLTEGCHTYVFFDDASYSGSQLLTFINKFREAVFIQMPDQKVRLIIVVPFMSSIAKEEVRRAMDDTIRNILAPGRAKIQLDLITTKRSITTLQKIFKGEENKLNELEVKENPYNSLVYCNGRSFNKCSTITEWKTPDDASLAAAMKKTTLLGKRYDFVESHKPPYKKENCSDKKD